MKKKKTKIQKPPKAKRGATCSGTWRFRGEGPEIKFRASPEQASFTFPRTMSRKAWTAFFRFMLATFTHVQPTTLRDTYKEFLRERRAKRIKRWRRRHPLMAKPKKVKPKIDPNTAPEPTPIGPSPELLATAKEKLKNERRPA